MTAVRGQGSPPRVFLRQNFLALVASVLTSTRNATQRNAAKAIGDGPEGPTPPADGMRGEARPRGPTHREKDGIEPVVVDTRPSVEADTEEIARLSDMVLIPIRPGILDLRAIAPTTNVVRVVKLPKGATIILLNGAPAARSFGENGLTREDRRTLHAYRLPSAYVSIGNRTAFAHALIDGRMVSKFGPHGQTADKGK